MTREFQVVYRLREALGADFGDMRALKVESTSENAVRSALASSDCVILSVVEVRPIVDWEKPVWDLDEFAAAMSIKGGTLSGKKGDGKIPWSSAVNGVPRRVALKWIEDTLNEAGKRIVEALEQGSRLNAKG